MMGIALSPLRALAAGLLVAFVVASHWWAYGAGRSHIQRKWDLQRAEEQSHAQQLALKQAQATAQVVTQYVDRVQVVRERGKSTVKEVPVYVPINSSACDLSGGFRLLHDAAATGSELPDPARIADAPAAPAQDVAATVADNYATYHEVAEQLKALQSWVSQQGAAQ